MNIKKYLENIKDNIATIDAVTYNIRNMCNDIENEFIILKDTISTLKDELKYKHEEIKDLKAEIREYNGGKNR